MSLCKAKKTLFFLAFTSVIHHVNAFLCNDITYNGISLPNTKSCSGKIKKTNYVSRTSSLTLQMAVTPIGPFCPFRSKASVAIEPNMENLNSATPTFATDMARLQLDMQMGNAPNPEKLIEVADGMEASVNEWENLLTNMSESNDFQTKEYYKLTEAHLLSHGQSQDEIATMMKWQANCMRAMASNQPPPLPPPTINLEKMMEEAKAAQQDPYNSKKRSPAMAAMANAEAITATPFTGNESAFDNPNVREEYEALCRDHASLIEMGGSYKNFDPVGKLAFIDQMELLEERWDIFFARFSLLGMLDKSFVKQCDAFLESMGLDENDFRTLLKKAHEMMREEAEKERNLMS